MTYKSHVRSVKATLIFALDRLSTSVMTEYDIRKILYAPNCRQPKPLILKLAVHYIKGYILKGGRGCTLFLSYFSYVSLLFVKFHQNIGLLILTSTTD